MLLCGVHGEASRVVFWAWMWCNVGSCICCLCCSACIQCKSRKLLICIDKMLDTKVIMRITNGDVYEFCKVSSSYLMP